MAAILSDTIAPMQGNGVVVLSGGNVDLETIKRVIG
jgi:hypothetical protein